jgi:urea transporter
MLTLSYIGMGSTEIAIRYAIEQLERDNHPITPHNIASIAQCHPRTVSRVFSIWRARGELTMEGSPRGGYKYILHSKSNQRHLK